MISQDNWYRFKIRRPAMMLTTPCGPDHQPTLSEVRKMATYRVRNCLFCGKQYQPNASHTTHCSTLCRFNGIAALFKDVDGCWEWPLSRNKQTGYGQFTLKPAPGQLLVTAHRLSYSLFVGPVAPNLCVMHRCDNRGCFNPDHLAVGTLADNNRDMHAKGRHWGATHKPVTICKRGHKKKLSRLGEWRCLPCSALLKRRNKPA